MASVNQKSASNLVTNHNGLSSNQISTKEMFDRTVMACLLWENNFYENGESVATRVESYIKELSEQDIVPILYKCKQDMKLRHMPLFILVCMAKYGKLKSKYVYDMITRVDDITELLSLYWVNGKCAIAKQLKIGLGEAFTKFNEYEFAKYNRDKAIKLRDVMFLVHAKPKNAEQVALFKKIADNTLATPDTWEVSLSRGDDKKTTFERLINERKLGGLALIRNIRNMNDSGVNKSFIEDAISNCNAQYLLPHNFIAAARHNPTFESVLESKMFESLSNFKKVNGKTVVFVDVSGSMDTSLSSKNENTRIDVACGLAMLFRELSDKITICSFSDKLVIVPARRGFALKDAIHNSQRHSGTDIKSALDEFYAKNIDFDNLIIITDEQYNTQPYFKKDKFNCVINVGCYENGLKYSKEILTINGFSDNIVTYLAEYLK